MNHWNKRKDFMFSGAISNRVVIALVVLLALAGGPCLSLARDSNESSVFEGLRGIIGVNVEVVFFTNSDGNELTEDRIKTDVEVRLRTSGIRVLTKEQALQTIGMPTLRIYVSAVTRKELENVFAYSILVAFSEFVKPQRAPQSNSVLAMTWGKPTSAGLVGKASLHRIRGQIVDQVDEFINAFLAANQK